MTLVLSAAARSASEGLAELFERAWGSRTRANRAAAPFDTSTWDNLRAGSWHLLGARDATGGAGFGLDELVGPAEVVGRYLAPVPLLPTLLVNRWRSAQGEQPLDMATFPVIADGRVWWPFGHTPGIVRARSASDAYGAAAGSDGDGDGFAYSLPLAPGEPGQEPWGAEQSWEAAVLLTASAVGAADEAVTRGAAYANEREQFGRPIGSFQAVAHQLSDAFMAVSLARTSVSWAISEPAASARALRAALLLCDDAVEHVIHVHGGIGFTWDAGVHFNLRHVLQVKKLLHDWIRARNSDAGVAPATPAV